MALFFEIPVTAPNLILILQDHFIDKLANSRFPPVTACEGYQGYSPQYMPTKDRIYVRCGLAIPPAAPGTNLDEFLSQPIRVCASSLRAVIKVTSFRYNDTGGAASLSDLEVPDVKPKSYPSEADRPVWGIENPGEGWNISEIQLLWGIIDSNKCRSREQFWAIQSDSIHLPAFNLDTFSGAGFDDSMVSAAISP